MTRAPRAWWYRLVDPSLPRYRDLPISADKPPRSSWGLFGDADEVGTVNLLTPERVAAAVRLVRTGKVFSLNLELSFLSPPLLGRRPLEHSIIDQMTGTDDRYDSFYPQSTSQWDALAHNCHPDFGYYNGFTRADITGREGSRVGIDHWARHGIVGRYVLIDVERDRRIAGDPIDMNERTAVTVDELDAILDRQGVRLETGDVLLVRYGWLAWYRRSDQATRERLGFVAPVPDSELETSGAFFPAPGLSPEERTAEWLWDHHVAAVAGDAPSLEAMPFDRRFIDTFLHYRVMALLGIAVGELFDLDNLARDSEADGVYEGLFSAAPLNKVGGSGSTANALAIK